MNGRRLLLLVCALAALAAAGCAGGLPGLTNTAERATTVYLLEDQPRTLDPARTLESAEGPIGHIFNGLVTLDPNLQVQPELAGGWDVSADGLVYTFYLLPTARFHDGRPLTAEDVRFSWERALAPATGSSTAATYLGDIRGAAELAAGRSAELSGVRVLASGALEVTLDAPAPYFLAKLTYPVAYVVDRHNVGEPGWEYRPNGSGPFKLVTWRDDDVLILERFDGYARPRGNVTRVVYRLGAGLPLALYEQNQIDLTRIGGDSLARALDPADPLAADLRAIVSLCTTFIGLNHRLPPFDDVRVRQAFNLAFDRQLVIDGLLAGNALPAAGVLPPGMPGYRSDLRGYPYDPARARALLAEAGYTAPLTLTFTAAGYGELNSLATVAAALWEANLGVVVQGETVEPFRYADQLYAGTVGQLFNFGWCADYPDPENFLDVLFHSASGQNFTGYANPAVDALLEQARRTADPAARLALYAAVEEQLVADAPYVFVSHNLWHVLVKPRVRDYVFTSIGVPQWQRVTLGE